MQPDDSPEPEGSSRNELEEAQRKLQATLTHPVDPPSPLSIPSAASPRSPEYVMDLLETVVLRVDQVAKTSAEQFSRVESTLEQMNATLELAQVMIAQQDQLQLQITDQIEQLQTALAATIKINANLTEIVAALVAPQRAV